MRHHSSGLPIETVTVEQALDGSWRHAARGADLVTVHDPPRSTWTDLDHAGFTVKPQAIMWRTRPQASEGEYRQTLSSKDRYDVRKSHALCVADEVEITVEELTDELIEEFLALYVQQIGAMRHAWLVAVEQREEIHANKDEYFAICARHAGSLVGVCLVEDLPHRGEARARFAAVAPAQRRASLSRVLYWELLAETRRRQRTWASLGRDNNLYGHIAKPGLFAFKSRLGFTLVPAQLAIPGSGSHQAERVVDFQTLTQPTLMLGYAPRSDGTITFSDALQLRIFTDGPGHDLRPYQGHELAGIQTITVPQSSTFGR